VNVVTESTASAADKRSPPAAGTSPPIGLSAGGRRAWGLGVRHGRAAV